MLTAIIVSGCSRASLVYDNADWLAVRWTAGLLDADSDQKAQWEPWFSKAVERHRGELLDEVVTLLDVLDRQVADGADARRLQCWLDAVDGSYRRHAELVVPVAVAVLGSVRPAQVEHLAAEFEERNAEYAQERLFDDPAAGRAARLERYIERIEAWVGELDAAQERLVERHLDAMPDLADDWLVYRIRQQRHLLALLRAEAPASDLRNFLLAWWRDLADRPEAMVAETDRLRDGMLAMLVDLDATLEDGQRERAVERLRDVRDGLASAGAGRAATTPRSVRAICTDGPGVA